MGSKLFKFTLSLNLALGVICIVHIGFIIHNILFPPIPSIKVYEKQLKDIEFPLLLRICINDKTMQRFKDVGYFNDWEFFLGKSRFNNSIYGWNGHTEDGSSIGSFEDVLSMVNHNWSNILKEIKVETAGESSIVQDFNWRTIPFYLYCQIIDLEEYFNLTNSAPHILSLHFRKTDAGGVSIHFMEKNKRSDRPLISSYLSYSGPMMSNDDLSVSKLFLTMSKLSQTIYSEEDEAKPCRNYPTQKFKSFGECDNKYIRSKLKDIFNMTPFWIEDNISKISSNR